MRSAWTGSLGRGRRASGEGSLLLGRDLGRLLRLGPLRTGVAVRGDVTLALRSLLVTTAHGELRCVVDRGERRGGYAAPSPQSTSLRPRIGVRSPSRWGRPRTSLWPRLA